MRANDRQGNDGLHASGGTPCAGAAHSPSAGAAVPQHARPTLQLLDHKLEFCHHFMVEDTKREHAYALRFGAKCVGGFH